MSDPPAETASWRVDASDTGRRLDVAVASHLEDVSRARVQRWIEEGRVRVDGQPARASRPCRSGEEILVEIPAPIPATPVPEPIPLSILYEDEHLLVLDKPAGIVVHPAPGHPSGTLVNALLAHCSDLSGIGGVERPGIVHRLDVGTTGTLVVAKHDRAHQGLAAAFQNRTVEKHYRAIVHGVTDEQFFVDVAIGRDPHHRTRISSRGPHRKQALTEVHRLRALPASSFLAIRLHTGRTHQIRVHLSESGFPLVGDPDYGFAGRSFPAPLAGFGRPALHAKSLAFEHPVTGAAIQVEAPLPEDMANLLARLEAADAKAHE